MVLGGGFIILAAVYLFISANSLPTFVHGFDPDLGNVHCRHGLAAFVVGAALLAYAWPSGRRK
jgi:hypothetical protein